MTPPPPIGPAPSALTHTERHTHWHLHTQSIHTHTASSVLYSCIFTQLLQNTVDIVYCSSSLVTFVWCLSYILVNAPRIFFLWPFGDNKGFYSILFSPSLCFFPVCPCCSLSPCLIFFPCFSTFPLAGALVCRIFRTVDTDTRGVVFFPFVLPFALLCFAFLFSLCCKTEKLSFFQSAALRKPCA